jgi:ABC-type sugar transport system permease subunit
MDPSATSVTMDNSAAPGKNLLKRWSVYKQRHRDAVLAWSILLPVLIYYFVFAVLPVIANILVSFTHWNGITAAEWVGFENFRRYFTDPLYQQIFVNTAIFAISTLLLQIPIGLVIAILLNQKIMGMSFYRAMWYVPTVTSAAIMAQLVALFISPYGGVVNTILAAMGFPAIVWTINATALRGVIIAFSIWRGVGGTMVLYLAALQAIPRELYEAAMVDGAGALARFWYLTIPMVRHMTAFVVVTGIIGAFQIFEPILLISKGGPFNLTNSIINQIYNDAFKNADFGLATASSTILAIFLLGASIISLRTMRQGE